MPIQVTTQEDPQYYSVFSEYSERTLAEFRRRAGTWSSVQRCWYWENGAKQNGREAVRTLFGLSDTSVKVRVPADHPGVRDGEQLTIGGYVLATRRGRDYKVSAVETLVRGTFPSSGGSARYPMVRPSEDAIFELEVRRDFALDNGLEIFREPSERDRLVAAVEAANLALAEAVKALEAYDGITDPN